MHIQYAMCNSLSRGSSCLPGWDLSLTSSIQFPDWPHIFSYILLPSAPVGLVFQVLGRWKDRNACFVCVCDGLVLFGCLTACVIVKLIAQKVFTIQCGIQQCKVFFGFLFIAKQNSHVDMRSGRKRKSIAKYSEQWLQYKQLLVIGAFTFYLWHGFPTDKTRV